MMTECPNCDDTHWVCEAHEDRPWEGTSPRACRCGAPGMPCPLCNADVKHTIMPGFQLMIDTKHGPRI